MTGSPRHSLAARVAMFLRSSAVAASSYRYWFRPFSWRPQGEIVDVGKHIGVRIADSANAHADVGLGSTVTTLHVFVERCSILRIHFKAFPEPGWGGTPGRTPNSHEKGSQGFILRHFQSLAAWTRGRAPNIYFQASPTIQSHVNLQQICDSWPPKL